MNKIKKIFNTLLFIFTFIFLSALNVGESFVLSNNNKISEYNNNFDININNINVEKKNINTGVQRYQFSNGGQLIATYIDDLNNNRIITTDNYLTIVTKADGITLDYFVVELYVYDKIYNSYNYDTYYFVNVYDVWANNNFDLLNLENLQLDISCLFNEENLTCTINSDLYFIYGVENETLLFDQVKSNSINCYFIASQNLTCTPFKFSDFGKLLVNSFDYGSTIGYESGYDEGRQLGYDEGYLNGQESSKWNDVLIIIEEIFNMLTRVLSVEILPNIKLIYIVAIPLILAVVKWILDWFK